MARGDASFGRTNVDWPGKPKCQQLKSAAYKWINNCLWLCCCKERRVRLPGSYDAVYMQWWCGVDARTYKKAVAKMYEIGLINIHEDNSITVYGVKENNEKLKWLDDYGSSPHVDDTGPIDSPSEREKESEKERESEIDDFASSQSISLAKKWRKKSTRENLEKVKDTIEIYISQKKKSPEEIAVAIYKAEPMGWIGDLFKSDKPDPSTRLIICDFCQTEYHIGEGGYPTCPKAGCANNDDYRR